MYKLHLYAGQLNYGVLLYAVCVVKKSIQFVGGRVNARRLEPEK